MLFILPLAIETRGVVRRLTARLGPVRLQCTSAGRAIFSQVSSDRFAELWEEIIELVEQIPACASI